jgi:hypothetical protein
MTGYVFILAVHADILAGDVNQMAGDAIFIAGYKSSVFNHMLEK